MSEAVFQVGIKALIRNASGDILLTREMNHDTVWWDIPGGRMDEGETMQNALIRELAEEVSLTVSFSIEHFMTVLSNKRIPAPERDYGLMLVVYVVAPNEDQELTANEQNREIAWVNPKEATLHLADKYPADFCDKVATLA